MVNLLGRDSHRRFNNAWSLDGFTRCAPALVRQVTGNAGSEARSCDRSHRNDANDRELQAQSWAVRGIWPSPVEFSLKLNAELLCW